MKTNLHHPTESAHAFRPEYRPRLDGFGPLSAGPMKWLEMARRSTSGLAKTAMTFFKARAAASPFKSGLTTLLTAALNAFLTLGTPTAHAQSGAAAVPTGPVLTIGVLPNVSARLILSSYQPMREYFERELQQRVEIATAPDFRSFSDQTLKGEYQLVVIAPNLGRVVQLDGQWEPLAIYEPRIPAVAVSLASNPDNSPSQLKGKGLALANPQSLVALVGLQWLRSQGLQAGSDFSTVVAANDDSLGALLRNGETPWAIMSLGEFRAKPEALRQTLRIVHEFARLPGFYVMGSPKLTAAQRQRLRALALQFPATEDGKRFFALSGFANIREITDADLKFVDPFNDITRRALGLKP